MEKIYDVIFDEALGGLYDQVLREAEDGIRSGQLERVPFLEIEDARDYVHDLNCYYENLENTVKN